MAKRKRPQLQKKKKTKNVVLYCIVIVILFAIACVSGRYSLQQKDSLRAALADTELQVHVIDVGQADSILVVADGEAMLIDAGEAASASAICTYLEELQITKLKYAVATHGHADHIGGYPQVLGAVAAERVMEPAYPDSLLPTTKTYENFLDAVEACGASLNAVQAGDSFMLGEAKVSVLGPVSEEISDLNNASLILRVEYDDVVCLFTGDAEKPAEEAVLASGVSLAADFLKVGHHGSDTSTSAAFLAAVKPQYAAISCGVDNEYGHPSETILERLATYRTEAHITAEEGSLVFAYDRESGTCGFVGTEENTAETKE